MEYIMLLLQILAPPDGSHCLVARTEDFYQSQNTFWFMYRSYLDKSLMYRHRVGSQYTRLIRPFHHSDTSASINSGCSRKVFGDSHIGIDRVFRRQHIES